MNEDDIIDIEDWSMIRHPFSNTMVLTGHVKGHPMSTKEGHKCTSSIQSICGNLVRTRNSIYRLGKVSDSYKKFCEENNLKLPGA